MTTEMAVRLRDVVGRIVRVIDGYADRKNDPDLRAVPGPPATEAQIQQLEQHLDRRLPDSYRTFLTLHNGFKRLAFFGDMLSIDQLLPPSRSYTRILEWKRLTAQYGGGEVLDGVVIADQSEPNHWVYLDPSDPKAPDEWSVVLHMTGDKRVFPDLVAYFENVLEELQAFVELSAGRGPGT